MSNLGHPGPRGAVKDGLAGLASPLLRLAAMRRALLAIVLFASVAGTARAGEGDDIEPEPAPPMERHIALAFVIRYPSGFGFDFSFFPIQRLQMGLEVSSWLFVSEAGLYARYDVIHEAADDLALGVRLHGLAYLSPDDEAPNPKYGLWSAEAGYEHRFGASFVGVDLAVAVRRDGRWFPTNEPVVTGGVRLGHCW